METSAHRNGVTEKEIEKMIKAAKKRYEIPDDVRPVVQGDGDIEIRYAVKRNGITVGEYGLYIDPKEKTMDAFIVSIVGNVHLQYRWNGEDWERVKVEFQ